jgi:hypothetical protein
MNDYYSGRSSRSAGLFSFGLLDGPQVRLRRLTCEKPTEGARLGASGVGGCNGGFGLSRFAPPFMNNPG